MLLHTYGFQDRRIKPYSATPPIKNLRYQWVTIPFFMLDRHMCVHKHFDTNFGGCGWSRTNIVYQNGTDLQSADAHAIASTHPKYHLLALLCYIQQSWSVDCSFHFSFYTPRNLRIHIDKLVRCNSRWTQLFT